MKKETKSFLIGLAVVLPFLVLIGWDFIERAMLPLEYKKELHECTALKITEGADPTDAACSCSTKASWSVFLPPSKHEQQSWTWALNRFAKEVPDTYSVHESKFAACLLSQKLRNEIIEEASNTKQ